MLLRLLLLLLLLLRGRLLLLLLRLLHDLLDELQLLFRESVVAGAGRRGALWTEDRRIRREMREKDHVYTREIIRRSYTGGMDLIFAPYKEHSLSPIVILS